MRRITLITTLFLCASLQGSLRSQEAPSGVDAAAAMEKVLVDAIARCEKSVVAIARVRKEQPGETFQLEFRPDPFGRRPTPLAPPQPTDPDFIPNEYGTGVVVDPRGLILTTYDLLGEESEYYVTTADHKVYKAAVKGADPRSNLAVLSIEAIDLTPIPLGNAAELKKGQIVISLGNPYAIARDGQASAAWGIVANLARKAPAMPSESDPTGRPTLHHYGTLIQTDAKLNLGTGGGPLLNLKGQMVGLSVDLGRHGRLRSGRRIRYARGPDVPPRGRDAQAGPRGRIRLLGHSADEPWAEGGFGRFARDAGGPGAVRHARRTLRPEGGRRGDRRGQYADPRCRRAGVERGQAARRGGHAVERAPRRQPDGRWK